MRYCNKLKTTIEASKTDAFLREVIEVCKKHGMSISHEDDQGNFIIQGYSEYLCDWLQEASVGDSNPESDQK